MTMYMADTCEAFQHQNAGLSLPQALDGDANLAWRCAPELRRTTVQICSLKNLPLFLLNKDQKSAVRNTSQLQIRER